LAYLAGPVMIAPISSLARLRAQHAESRRKRPVAKPGLRSSPPATPLGRVSDLWLLISDSGMEAMRMRLTLSFFGRLFVICPVISLLGCDAGSVQRVPVHGKVTYRGVPLFTGIIVFTPDANRGSAGPQARAELQPDGTYNLKTADQAGAFAGWYRVTVVALDTPAPIPGQQLSIPRSLIPEKYRDPDISGLTCEVRTGTENKINFNLE